MPRITHFIVLMPEIAVLARNYVINAPEAKLEAPESKRRAYGLG
jgi:hypothetical protein